MEEVEQKLWTKSLDSSEYIHLSTRTVPFPLCPTFFSVPVFLNSLLLSRILSTVSPTEGIVGSGELNSTQLLVFYFTCNCECLLIDGIVTDCLIQPDIDAVDVEATDSYKTQKPDNEMRE
ncbi:hypothetical protein ACTXT7_000748 [Hymenolepis weldensis]